MDNEKCPMCGKPLVSGRPYAKYCSYDCCEKSLEEKINKKKGEILQLEAELEELSKERASKE